MSGLNHYLVTRGRWRFGQLIQKTRAIFRYMVGQLLAKVSATLRRYHLGQRCYDLRYQLRRPGQRTKWGTGGAFPNVAFVSTVFSAGVAACVDKFLETGVMGMAIVRGENNNRIFRDTSLVYGFDDPADQPFPSRNRQWG